MVGGVFDPGKRDQAWNQGLDQTWTGKYCWWTTSKETKRRLQPLACPEWILRLDVPLAPWANLVRPPPCPTRGTWLEGRCRPWGRFASTAPKHAAPVTQRFILVMVAPSQTSHVVGFQPEGFGLSVPTLGILEVAWQSDGEGRKASLGWWCKKASRRLFSCTSCPSSSWWPSSLSSSKVPVRPHGAGWWQPGRGQPCYSQGEQGRREVGSMRVSQECFSITGTHFCSSQRCWKASYVTRCEGLGHSWSDICKQNQQFNLKKRQVVSHASSPLAYFRLPDLSAPWCCLFHC